MMPAEQKTIDREIDFQLAEQVKQGDKAAFKQLVEKYQSRLNRLVMRIIKDESEVDDIVQESFVKAHNAINNFKGDSAFYTWLYRIAVNSSIDYLATKKGKVVLV